MIKRLRSIKLMQLPRGYVVGSMYDDVSDEQGGESHECSDEVAHPCSSRANG